MESYVLCSYAEQCLLKFSRPLLGDLKPDVRSGYLSFYCNVVDKKAVYGLKSARFLIKAIENGCEIVFGAYYPWFEWSFSETFHFYDFDSIESYFNEIGKRFVFQRFNKDE